MLKWLPIRKSLKQILALSKFKAGEPRYNLRLFDGGPMKLCTLTAQQRKILFCCLVGIVALAVSVSHRFSAQEKSGVGLVLTGKVGPEDVGLPLYPKSIPFNDENNETKTGHVGLWGGGSGFNVAALNMEAFAPPKKVAKFYWKALAKYGAVIDCSTGVPTPAGSD